MPEKDLEQELRDIIREEVVFPDIPAPVVNVEAPIVNVPAPIVNVPAPIVNVPEPRVTVEAPQITVDNTAVAEAITGLKQSIEANKTTNDDIVEALDDVASRLETSYKEVKVVGGGSGGIGQYLYNTQSVAINPATAEGQANTGIYATDSASIDAFSRWRVSNPSYVFDTNFQYDLQPLVFEAVTTDTETTVTHDSTNRCALMTFNAADSGNAYMQSYEHFRYQAGRSQEALITFNFIEPKANVTKFVGYSDGANGIELRQTGSAIAIHLLSDTAKGDESVAQADWNIDPMDGTGPSGVTINFTKTHIFFIDFQWLGVGRVRCGFDIDGVVYYVHEFIHANIQTVPYMQTANLPIRAGMTCSGTASTTMRFVCASVASEGGQEDVGGYNFTVGASGTAGNDARAHILSLRPKTTFNSIANRSKLVLESMEVVVTGNNPVYWELCLGQAISGTTTFADVNTTYSGTEYNTAGTISGTPAIVIASGYVSATAANKTSASKVLASKYPISLNVAGAVRSLGTLSVIATGLGAASACRVALNWREIR